MLSFLFSVFALTKPFSVGLKLIPNAKYQIDTMDLEKYENLVFASLVTINVEFYTDTHIFND